MTSFQNSLSKSPLFNLDFKFGDKRINCRADYMFKKMSQNSQKSLPQVFCNQADLKGAYRFFCNGLVTPEKILEPHINETIKRCKSHKLVAVLQDSSDLDFDYMDCLEGFNPLHPNVDKGYRIHPSLVITEHGTPLGVLGAENYTREKINSLKKHRNSLLIEEKESFRWLQGFRQACKLAEQLQDVQVVSIADREGDVYECLAEAQVSDVKHKAAILVRSKHNRSLAEFTDETNNKLEKKLIRSAVSYESSVILNRYRKEERKAFIAIRACQVSIKAPNTCKKKSLPPILMNAILISEIDPPKGKDPLDWLLLTTLPIGTKEEIQLIISLYSKRWCIEIYFKVLKSGCKIDTPHFQETKNIKNFIAFAMIVAWKVMLTTYLPREFPDEPCTLLFTEIEWKLAYRGAQNKIVPFPDKIPTLKEMVTLVAILGGYQKRKMPPGIQTVWRGVVKLMVMVYGYELTHGITLSQ
jgi:hypothetical protein